MSRLVVFLSCWKVGSRLGMKEGHHAASCLDGCKLRGSITYMILNMSRNYGSGSHAPSCFWLMCSVSKRTEIVASTVVDFYTVGDVSERNCKFGVVDEEN